jgi:hypothetical protein
MGNKQLATTFRGLAFDPIKRYFLLMAETFRRVATVLLALTFVVGLVPHGMRAADAGVKMVMAATVDMPMPGKCDGCGDGQKAMTSAACSAFCGSFVALPSIGAVFEPASAEAFEGIAGPPPAGLTVPPDPYPPRPAVLN